MKVFQIRYVRDCATIQNVRMEWFDKISIAKKRLKELHIEKENFDNHLFEYNITNSKDGVLYFLNKYVK